MLDTLVAQGANQVNGPSFEIDKPDEAYDEARIAALKKAQARAETYAKAMNLRVRRVVSISEGGGFQPPIPMMRMQAMDAMAAKETSVSPGENTLSVEPRRRVRTGELRWASVTGPHRQLPTPIPAAIPAMQRRRRAIESDVTRPAPKPAPSPDEPGMTRDPDAGACSRSDTADLNRCLIAEARHPAGFAFCGASPLVVIRKPIIRTLLPFALVGRSVEAQARLAWLHACSDKQPHMRRPRVVIRATTNGGGSWCTHSLTAHACRPVICPLERPDATRIAAMSGAIAINAIALLLLLMPMSAPPPVALPDANPTLTWVLPRKETGDRAGRAGTTDASARRHSQRPGRNRKANVAPPTDQVIVEVGTEAATPIVDTVVESNTVELPTNPIAAVRLEYASAPPPSLSARRFADARRRHCVAAGAGR